MKWLKWVFIVFVALYSISLCLLAIGGFGMATLFLLPLGLPWFWLADQAGLLGVIALVRAALLLSPLINAAILFWLWKR